MRNRQMGLRALCVLAALAGAPAALAADLTVEITDFASNDGQAIVRLFDDAGAFPTEPDKAVATKTTAIANRRATVLFENVAPGSYAIAVAHDENASGELDFNFMGIPKEPFGFSNDARGRFGPPSFEKARFTHGKDAHTVMIRMQ